MSECLYCDDWNRLHPQEAPRTSCGPCEFCTAPGHIGAHPRQPVSLCLCPAHWAELGAAGYHFELSHLIYVAMVLMLAASAYPLLARWF